MNKFKILSVFTSMLFFYLFYLLLFYADSFLKDLGLEGSDVSSFIARRAAMLMLGAGVLMFFARNIVNPQARQAISLSICTTMLGLALSGMYEYNRGFVGGGIVGPIVIELGLFASFIYVIYSDKVKVKYLKHKKLDVNI